MAYLYLDFSENMDKGSKSWDDFYNSSLNNQFDFIKRKIDGLNCTFQEFLENAFPSQISQNYYISMPSFDREIKQNRKNKNAIYNIVIRPEKNSYLNNFLPEKYDLIIIGDVTFNKIIDITIKGIDLIDANIAKFGEIKVNCYAAKAIETKTLYIDDRKITVPDFGTRDLKNSVLTPNFVDQLCKDESCYPVPNPSEALSVFESWNHYIDFRKYYLGKLSERCEKIDAVIVCDSYMISKETYRRNEDYFTNYLLDDISEFSRGEQIILSKNLKDSESFPLIRIDINKNRKEVLAETIGKFGKGKSKYEVNLQRYTKDSMGLSKKEPTYDENGNFSKGNGFNKFLLGERYLLTHVDIEPNCSDLEQKFDSDSKSEFNKIDSHYSSIISNDLKKFMDSQKTNIDEKYDSMLYIYNDELNNSLELDIKNNQDKEVKRTYEKNLENIAADFDNKINKIDYSFDESIKKIKNKKLKEKEERKKIEELEQEKINQIEKMREIKEITLKEVSLRELYVERNNKLIENKKKSLSIQKQDELDRIIKEKKKQLELQYKNEIEEEKTKIHSELRQKFAAEKALKIENETIRRYQIYFRPNSSDDKITNINKEINCIEPHYLIYDNRAEKAKIERQEKALKSFMGGYVKNPFLPTYLFAPETLTQNSTSVLKDPVWYLESLNNTQKLAVKKALASESIFLLQGPPGTGKTQVIAEITAQFAKQGKKILISSETHKAIDNVFERLPKIPEIMPLRLIPSQNGKETSYSPECLVDNFYLNISGNLEKQIKKFENFEDYKKNFDENISLLRIDYQKILKLKKENIQIENKRNELLKTINTYNENLEKVRDSLSNISNEIDEYKRTNKCITSLKFSYEGVKEQYIDKLKNKIQELLKIFNSLSQINIENASDLYNLDIGLVRIELSHILSDDTIIKLQERKLQLQNELQKLRDQNTDEAPKEGDDNYEQYKKKQTELIEISKQINSMNSSNFDFSKSTIYSIIPNIIGKKNLLKNLPEELTLFKIQTQKIIDELKNIVDDCISKYSSKYNETKGETIDIQQKITENKYKYEELGNNQGIEEYSELSSKLKQNINRFFRDFNITKEYDSDNLETAFDIITEEWNVLENDYKKTVDQNKKKIPIYKEICKYLEQDDIIEEDRKSYTRELYNCANVFGITCTSRDRFTKNQLAELEKYGIESVDIKTQGIDVVIIDEVSKSSFLDLLIPILYGKTVILVGDHRQLPPMYDLRHMRKEDFEGLDEDKITKEINDSYTELYETCFFKTLYEKIPEDFRVMLNKQYRCHSHIMEVFNHFYGGTEKGLIAGKKQQDDEKQHNITVRIKNNTIIEPKYHVYFIDCDQKESSAYEGSTSKINEQEAQVTIELLKEINKASIDIVKSGKIIVDKSKKIDERLSAGIICTYGDQASLIKKMRKGQKFDGFSEKQDERLIISTVDDFQGDERDVIILSMVRNPSNSERANAEFIKKFERINVALSRARKLLIVVGSKKYLSKAGIIDLPDLTGNHSLDKHNFHVYKEIIDTIYFRGKVLTASDIIGE